MADDEKNDEPVLVEDMSSDNAVLLLDAAQALKLEPGVVRTTSDGFLVPQEVSDKAFGKGKTSHKPAASTKGDDK